ncbi:MAG: hypothetical protein LIO97_01855 [Tannerellaceae bacterium]|nr:hypothetical protein [Tannerellaceae bacterium]
MRSIFIMSCLQHSKNNINHPALRTGLGYVVLAGLKGENLIALGIIPEYKGKTKKALSQTSIFEYQKKRETEVLFSNE